jgi:hypothetical protein
MFTKNMTDYEQTIENILKFRKTLKDKHLWKISDRVKYFDSLTKTKDEKFLSLICNIQNILKFNQKQTLNVLIKDIKVRTCKVCDKRYFPTSKNTNTCSKNCTLELRKRTNLAKYGSEYVGQVEQFKNKIKHTNLEIYGVEHPAQNQEVQNKTVQTNIERYGCKSTFQNKSVQQKYKETCLKRYGVENTMQYTDFKSAWKEKFKEKYNVENPSQVAEIQAKKKEVLFQDFLNELRNISYIKHFHDINSDYLKTFVTNECNQVYFDLIKCCDYYNLNARTVNKLKNYFNISIPNLFTRSEEERKLFNWIPCNNKISNDRKIIYPLELDMVLPDCKLAIEYDGVYWHSDEYKPKNYHLNKTIACNNKGIQLFHIFESDDIDIWKSMINNKLKLNTKVYARKCLVKEIDYALAKSFCAQNHLQGSCPSKINLGLFYNNELLEVMTFGKPRYTQKYQYELLRLCTKKYYSVIGGASKLFKYFKQTYNPNSIISYANRRFSNGSIYETLEFKFKHASDPNYWYVKDGELLSRVKCQKHKLRQWLPKFNENMSESENMLNNGYTRIFDCGNLVYEYSRE